MSLKTADNYIVWFSNQINQLRNDSPSPNVLSSVFNMLLNSLKKRKQYGKYQELWKELYKRSVQFYNGVEYIGKNNIPITLVTKHNDILSFYMKQRLHNYSNAILRFDTHSDLNPIKNSSLLPVLYQKYLDTNDSRYIEKAQDLVWDIGAAKSGVLFATGIKDVIWCLPSWVPDQEITMDYYIKQGKRNLTLATTTDIEKIHNMDEWTQGQNSKNSAVQTFLKVQTGKINKHRMKHIIDIVRRHGTNYILDIDLDYFVCNGTKFTKKYFKESYDLQSFYRTPDKYINQMFPRNVHDNTRMLQTYEKQLAFEMKQINKRIKRFSKMIAYLRKKGYTPSHISICDSTNILFEDCKKCNSISNGYVPQIFALHVHSKVLDILKTLL
jgi:hypothetical protein